MKVKPEAEYGGQGDRGGGGEWENQRTGRKRKMRKLIDKESQNAQIIVQKADLKIENCFTNIILF